MHTLHGISMGRNSCYSHPLLYTHSRSARLVHWCAHLLYECVMDPLILSTVCYSLGIYLLNLFLAFLQPKFDPSLSQDENLEDGDSSQPTLPTKQDEEFRPFIRRLPEFKFWHSSTRAIAIAFVCTWFGFFNVPVFWPVLVVYFIVLFSLTSKCQRLPLGTCIWKVSETETRMSSAKTNSAHDQVSLRAFHFWQGEIQPTEWTLSWASRMTDGIPFRHVLILSIPSRVNA